jgi:hypothetical protein
MTFLFCQIKPVFFHKKPFFSSLLPYENRLLFMPKQAVRDTKKERLFA